MATNGDHPIDQWFRAELVALEGPNRQRFLSFDQHLQEATASVEDELALEDRGWVNLSNVVYTGLTPQERITAVKNSRLYFIKDPLARQAIRLWTNYSFGSGMTFDAEDENVQKIINNHWLSKTNRPILGTQGQLKSSDKLLVDGEIFFALFPGRSGEVTVRRIDPLEITEIITNPDDIEDVRYYVRQWATPQGQMRKSIYRSLQLAKVVDIPTPDSTGSLVTATEDALVYHMAINTIGQRGNPLLLPAIDWIKQYRRFLAARVAVMLAAARFAWKTKFEGGATALSAIKNTFDDKTPEAGAMLLENMGVTTTPIRSETGAKNAYDDARLIKLQVSAAVGIPEQYWGDISTGNLATAKTVELPMLKQFQSYQKTWQDGYRDMDELVLASARIPETKWYVDRDFPAIAPEDAAELAKSIALIVNSFPGFNELEEVQQAALMSMGIDDVAKVLEGLEDVEDVPAIEARLIRAMENFTEVLRGKGAL